MSHTFDVKPGNLFSDDKFILMPTLNLKICTYLIVLLIKSLFELGINLLLNVFIVLYLSLIPPGQSRNLVLAHLA